MRSSVKWTLGCGLTSALFFGLLTLLFAILYFTYQPDAGQQVLCGIGSSAACSQLQQAAGGHVLDLFALLISGILFVGSLLIGGITLLALLLP